MPALHALTPAIHHPHPFPPILSRVRARRSAAGGASAVGPQWHLCLGRLLCMCTRLVRGGAPGTTAPDDTSERASAMLQVGLATLSVLVDDGRASEFAYNTDIALLQARERLCDGMGSARAALPSFLLC